MPGIQQMHYLPRDLSQHYERYTVGATTEHKNLKYPRDYHRVELVPSHASFFTGFEMRSPGLRLLSTFYFFFPPPMALD